MPRTRTHAAPRRSPGRRPPARTAERREDAVAEHPIHALQQAIGNRRVVQLATEPAPRVQRGLWDWLTGKKKKGKGSDQDASTGDGSTARTYPCEVEIGKEKVRVASAEEEAEARRIIGDLKDTYGITLSSATTIAGIKAHYSKVAGSELKKLSQGTWEMKELRALQAACAHFGPILGEARKDSSLAKTAQGVTSVGRLRAAIDDNSSAGEMETPGQGTMGEYFNKKKNVGLFDTVTDLVDDRYVRAGQAGPSNDATLEANAIHEMAHGLVEPLALGTWVKGLAFWKDAYTPSGKAGAETPPTEYGHSSASEDLAESVAIYFINKARMESAFPERAALIAGIIAGWSAKTKKKAVAAASGTGA